MKIKIYTLPDSAHCEKAKKYLEEKGLSFEELDVSRENFAQEMMEKSGQLNVPTLLFQKDEHEDVVIGFDEDGIEQALKENQ